VIICYSVFVALMLYQTPYKNLGTITAFASIVLVFFFGFVSGVFPLRKIKLTREIVCMSVFLVSMTLSTLSQGTLPDSYAKLVAQVLLFMALSTVKLQGNEHFYLKWVYLLAGTVYAAIAIHSCVANALVRRLHGMIVIFNTEFDPNYIGIAFVGSTALILDNILRNNKRLICILLYGINVVAILYSASRGSMLSFAVSNLAVLLLFFARDGKLTIRKIGRLLMVVGCAAVLWNYVSVNFADQWTRISNVGLDANNGRFELWQRAIDAWFQSPIWGNGLRHMYNTYGIASHNTYFQLLSETGLIGLTCFAQS